MTTQQASNSTGDDWLSKLLNIGGTIAGDVLGRDAAAERVKAAQQQARTQAEASDKVTKVLLYAVVAIVGIVVMFAFLRRP